jgi:hypothetical protein
VQPDFLFHPRPGRRIRRYTQADGFSVYHREITRATGRQLGGFFSVHEGTGRYDRTRIWITRKGGDSAVVPATAAGVKAGVRRLRPEEAEQLDELDARIEAAKAVVRGLNAERDELTKVAWRKAHVVRLSEVLPEAGSNRRRVGAPPE